MRATTPRGPDQIIVRCPDCKEKVIEAPHQRLLPGYLEHVVCSCGRDWSRNPPLLWRLIRALRLIRRHHKFGTLTVDQVRRSWYLPRELEQASPSTPADVAAPELPDGSGKVSLETTGESLV